MSNNAQLIGMFAELCYRKRDEKLASNNPAYLKKALELQETTSRVAEWACDTFTTMDSTYNLLQDPLFSELVQVCGQAVIEMSVNYGVEGRQLVCKDAWVNVAMPGDYQEYHQHPMSHFSVVYYVNAPEACGNLILRSHAADKDMMPLPTKNTDLPNAKTYFVIPQAGEIVIFRSNQTHMVDKNRSKDPRVSVALNYVFE